MKAELATVTPYSRDLVPVWPGYSEMRLIGNICPSSMTRRFTAIDLVEGHCRINISVKNSRVEIMIWNAENLV